MTERIAVKGIWVSVGFGVVTLFELLRELSSDSSEQPISIEAD